MNKSTSAYSNINRIFWIPSIPYIPEIRHETAQYQLHQQQKFGEPVKLKEFFSSQIPPYAILSHTWDDEEVTFQDITSSTGPPYDKAGFPKSEAAASKPRRMDTSMFGSILADKTSSAELSEAINSMYKWYQQADICYAYLLDIATAERASQVETMKLRNSKWFTRGWTFQELIAPRSVEFYARDWADLGTKSSRRDEISNITDINVRILDGDDPAIYNVAERLSWAASRTTARIEDAAYCLPGFFQVHIPLLYGEGESALIRLQEEVLRTTEDYTLLARGADISINEVKNKNALASDLSEYHRPPASTWRYSDLVLDKHTWTDAFLRQNSTPWAFQTHNCSVFTSWAISTQSLPWKSKRPGVIQSLSLHARVLIHFSDLKARGDFMVAFGRTRGKLWCCILVRDESSLNIPIQKGLHLRHAWKQYEGFIPNSFIDRATKSVHIGVFNVSIRNIAPGLVLKVHIDDWSSIGELPSGL